MDLSKLGCWAASFGDCEGGLTREHIILNGILGTKVRVQGFPWCQDKEVEIGAGSLTCKFLCQKHNNALSPYDLEVIKFAEAMKDIVKGFAKYEKYGFSPKSVLKEFNIDGVRLEKWFLKSLINIALLGDNDVAIDFDAVLPVLYSSQDLEAPYGLYNTALVGESYDSREFVEVLPIFSKPASQLELAGGLFILFGFHFIILIPNSDEPQIENARLTQLSNSPYNPLLRKWQISEVVRHPIGNEIRMQRLLASGSLTKEYYLVYKLSFEWPDRADTN